jgi:hypothetical protein
MREWKMTKLKGTIKSRREKKVNKASKKEQERPKDEDLEPEVTDNVGVTHIAPKFICE